MYIFIYSAFMHKYVHSSRHSTLYKPILAIHTISIVCMCPTLHTMEGDSVTVEVSMRWWEGERLGGGCIATRFIAVLSN